MSLTARRPRHATTPVVPPSPELVTARAELIALRQQLARAAADARGWKFRALSAEHVLAVLPAALADPDRLIRKLYAEKEDALHAVAELRAQLAQHQPATEPDAT